MSRSTRRRGSSVGRIDQVDGRIALTFLAFATGRSGRFQIAFVVLLLLSLLYVFRHGFTTATYRRVVVANPFFAAFTLWWCVSAMWARDLQAGVIDAGIFATGWLALGLCRRRLTIDRILWSLVVVSATMAATDLVLFLADLSFVRSPSGDLAGLIGSKNHTSFLAAMGLSALFGLWRGRQVNPTVGVVAALPLTVVLWLGNSEAAVGVVASGLLVQLWSATRGRYTLARRAGILVTAGAVGFVLVAVVSQGDRRESASDGLAGRLPLWTAVWQETTEQPIQGWGPGVWRSPEIRPAKTVVAAARARFGIRSVTYAHSTYLDVLLQTGWIGLVLFLAAIGRLLARLRRHREMAALVVGALVAGIVDTRFPNDLTTPILLFAIHLSAGASGRSGRPSRKDGVALPG